VKADVGFVLQEWMVDTISSVPGCSNGGAGYIEGSIWQGRFMTQYDLCSSHSRWPRAGMYGTMALLMCLVSLVSWLEILFSRF
jgi:hypothetical protein